MGVPILTSEGFEADDVIGTLARAGRGGRVRGRHRHRRQGLLPAGGEAPSGSTTRKDDGAWFDADGVKEKFGVLPSQVVDVLALMGDTSDNVKGVPGIGEKGARDLISTFGSLDALLDRAAEVKAKKQREALLAHADDARLSRELVTIDTDVPVAFDPDGVALPGRVARALLRAVLDAGVPHAGDRVRADRGVGREGLRRRRHARKACAISPARSAAPAASPCASSPTARRGCAPASSAWSSPPAPARRGSCRLARPRWSARPVSIAPARCGRWRRCSKIRPSPRSATT